jgi:hypothetical protein
MILGSEFLTQKNIRLLILLIATVFWMIVYRTSPYSSEFVKEMKPSFSFTGVTKLAYFKSSLPPVRAVTMTLSSNMSCLIWS